MENRGCDAEQTRALPAAALHQVSLLCARSSRSPSAHVPTGATRVHHPATPRPRPAAHLALHLHGAQAAAAHPVPVAAVHAERRAGGRLDGGRPSGARAAGPRSAGSGLGAPHGAWSPHLPRSAPRHAVPAAPRRPEGRTGSEAGGDAGPSQGGSGAAATAVTRGRSTVPQPPQPSFPAASPRARARPGARARRHGCSRGGT